MNFFFRGMIFRFHVSLPVLKGPVTFSKAHHFGALQPLVYRDISQPETKRKPHVDMSQPEISNDSL